MITQPRSSSFTGAAVLIAATVLAATIPSYFNLRTESPARQQAALQIERSVSLTEFEQVRPGLSATQVNSLLGRSGQEVSRIELTDAPVTALYTWQNPDGSSVNITFQNGVVITKTQSGLH
ncbi:MAG: hypothetical protein F6K28_41145 [Microcoleus sp. SIO2G3]|nr:hypothetical protein [Microcoleus sp. SIO2G3]